jgi:DNA-binding Lrp family transcriptional regulator
MVTAIVLLKVETTKINETAEKCASLEKVSEVFSVGGEYDLVVLVRAENNEEVADVVTNHVLTLEGVTDSTTMIAFRAYAPRDIDGVFTAGFEE